MSEGRRWAQEGHAGRALLCAACTRQPLPDLTRQACCSGRRPWRRRHATAPGLPTPRSEWSRPWAPRHRGRQRRRRRRRRSWRRRAPSAAAHTPWQRAPWWAMAGLGWAGLGWAGLGCCASLSGHGLCLAGERGAQCISNAYGGSSAESTALFLLQTPGKQRSKEAPAPGGGGGKQPPAAAAAAAAAAAHHGPSLTVPKVGGSMHSALKARRDWRGAGEASRLVQAR